MFNKLWVIFIMMLFCHIIDDYVLQGILSKLKQKKYWEENAPKDKQELYKNDYIMALIMHSISWSTMIMLPILIFSQWSLHFSFIFIWLINIGVHAYVDDLKANKFKINLIQDQLTHVIQIIFTFLYFLGWILI